MSETDFSSANVLSRLFSSISVDKLKASNDVMTAWQQTLYSIKGPVREDGKMPDYGSQLADHSRIIDLKNDILIVETDHPGRIQMFQLYKRYILNGLKKKIPGIPVNNIVFKLKKIEDVTSGLRMPTAEEMDKAVAEQADRAERATQNVARAPDGAEGSSSGAASLPPELQDMFSDMKNNLKG